MISDKQINEYMQMLEKNRVIIERLKENPYYVQYDQLKKLMVYGEQVEADIVYHQSNVDKLQIQVKQMAQLQQRQQTQHQNPQQQQQTDSFGYPVPQQQQQYQQQQASRQQQYRPQQQQQMPMQQTDMQPTQEEMASQIFTSKPEELGTDEPPIDFEGLPEFEDDK